MKKIILLLGALMLILSVFGGCKKQETPEPVLSSNAGLNGLSLSSGTLSPGFSTAEISYTASEPNTVSNISVTAVKSDGNAVIQARINGGSWVSITSGSASESFNLNTGANTLEVRVTAQDGTTMKTYTVIITREVSNNANLSSLILSIGTLSPVFGSETISYTASEPNTVSNISVTAVKSDGNAVIQARINGGSWVLITSGSASESFNLNTGANTLEVRVTAQDGTTVKTYTVAITRESSSAGDTSAPAVSNGTLNITAVTTTGFTVSWTAAADETTAAANLSYRVYYSTADFINNVATAVQQTPFGDWTANITTQPISGLTSATAYFVTVVVKDAAGNQSVYSKNPVMTLVATTTTPVQLTITSSVSAVTRTNPIPVTLTFSETVTGFQISDLTVTNGTAGNFVNTTADKVWTANIVPSGQGLVTISVAANSAMDKTYEIKGNAVSNTLEIIYDSVAPTNQNTVFGASALKKGGASVTIVSSGDASNSVWFAPIGTTVFAEGTTMTKAGGTATSINAPATDGSYKLYVIDQAGNISNASTAVLTVESIAPTNQDTVFASSLVKKGTGGFSVSIVSSGDTSNSVWFAPEGTTVFAEGTKMTKAGGTATAINAPADPGIYKLFVIDQAGNVSNPSAAILKVEPVYSYPFSDTGITQCYGTEGIITCPLSGDWFGQDANYNNIPYAPSYTDSGNGTVTDNVTGLVWQKCSAGQNNDDSCSGTAAGYTYQNAISYCENLSLGGRDDWRVPAIEELYTIVNFSVTPTIESNIFPNTSDYYWTSTPYSPSLSSNAWIIFFTYGTNGYSNMSSNRKLRCIAGGA